MTFLVARVARTRWILHNVPRTRSGMALSANLTSSFSSCCRCFQRAENPKKSDGDPRINELGRAIEDDFATIRENYGAFTPFSQRSEFED